MGVLRWVTEEEREAALARGHHECAMTTRTRRHGSITINEAGIAAFCSSCERTATHNKYCHPPQPHRDLSLTPTKIHANIVYTYRIYDGS